mmetsp:Transcript_9205/g.23216  ORF Transcript_9205/g.23216 Transcript_9205/m.23216 type:complete len:236 (+) Transcript_9205:4229-4936(+)
MGCACAPEHEQVQIISVLRLPLQQHTQDVRRWCLTQCHPERRSTVSPTEVAVKLQGRCEGAVTRRRDRKRNRPRPLKQRKTSSIGLAGSTTSRNHASQGFTRYGIHNAKNRRTTGFDAAELAHNFKSTITVTPSVIERLHARAVAAAGRPRALINPNKHIPQDARSHPLSECLKCANHVVRHSYCYSRNGRLQVGDRLHRTGTSSHTLQHCNGRWNGRRCLDRDTAHSTLSCQAD